MYPGTTLELSFPERLSAFELSGAVSTDITILPEHTHLTVDGIETHVDIPGLTTAIVVSSASNVIVRIPATTTQMTIPSVEYVFSAVTAIVSKNDGNTYYCGDNTETTLAANDGNTCVMATTFTVTLPSNVSPLFLHYGGLTTSFLLEGITTTFSPEGKTVILSAIDRDDS